MKVNYSCEFKRASNIMYAFCLAVVVFFSSCKKDNDGSAFFELKDDPGSLTAPSQGTTQTYTVKSNGSWKIEPLRDENWVTIDQMEGQGDGSFTITVAKNTTMDERTLTVIFVVDGTRQNKVLEIEQEGGAVDDDVVDQYLTVDGMTSMSLNEDGVFGRYTIRSTGAWRIELLDVVDWFSIDKTEGVGDTPVLLEVGKNMATEDRSVRLALFLDDVQQPDLFVIQQEAAQVEIIFSEDFDWLEYGNAVFYTTTGETIISNWSAEEKARGWTSSPSADGSTPAYARPGFVKLGKTNYGGDIISPKLAAVTGTQNLVVKFKAVPYQTAAGTRDGTVLKINVIGPGEVSVDEFDISNWPDYAADPTCTEIWKMPETERSFVITGATAETQIRFLGGGFDLRAESGAPINRNRIFLDDIVVTVQK